MSGRSLASTAKRESAKQGHAREAWFQHRGRGTRRGEDRRNGCFPYDRMTVERFRYAHAMGPRGRVATSPEAGFYSAHFVGTGYLPTYLTGGQICAPDEASWRLARAALLEASA
jgi:hypothetical protein